MNRDQTSLVPRPFEVGGGEGGRGKEGLVFTAYECAVIIQILNNPVTYGYCLVYLPFDLNASCSMYLEMAGLDSSNFTRNFEAA